MVCGSRVWVRWTLGGQRKRGPDKGLVRVDKGMEVQVGMAHVALLSNPVVDCLSLLNPAKKRRKGESGRGHFLDKS